MTDFTTMPLVRPRAVSPGDTVAVVSTSWGGAGLLAERFHRGVQALESLGYEVRVTRLRNVGLLAGLSGLVVGRTPGWDESQIAQLYACVLDAVAGYDYPVLAGVECTHSAPLLTLPIGVLATVDDEELVVEEAAVS